jgi:hypothetical protein
MKWGCITAKEVWPDGKSDSAFLCMFSGGEHSVFHQVQEFFYVIGRLVCGEFEKNFSLEPGF